MTTRKMAVVMWLCAWGLVGAGASGASESCLMRTVKALEACRADACGVSPTIVAAIYGWTFSGELVGALTRVGKMPVIYETIGGYGGAARIKQFSNGKIAFHKTCDVGRTPAGVVGTRFIDSLSAMLRRIEKEERGDMDRAGAWAREAREQYKRLYMYSMGHIFPFEIADTEIGKLFQSGEFHAGFRWQKELKDPIDAGDVVVHIGYQHPPSELVRRTRSAKANAAYVCIRSDRDFVTDTGVAWIDPMWDWPDACVTLEGYDVPLLPASGVVNCAIAWEIYRLTTAKP